MFVYVFYVIWPRLLVGNFSEFCNSLGYCHAFISLYALILSYKKQTNIKLMTLNTKLRALVIHLRAHKRQLRALNTQ